MSYLPGLCFEENFEGFSACFGEDKKWKMKNRKWKNEERKLRTQWEIVCREGSQ
jgi:hypothetical protein